MSIMTMPAPTNVFNLHNYTTVLSNYESKILYARPLVPFQKCAVLKMTLSCEDVLDVLVYHNFMRNEIVYPRHF